jgi:hypothetical protein
VKAQRPHRDNVADTNPRNFHAPYRHERHGSWLEIDGYSDSPDGAAEDRGRRYQRAVIGALARAFVEFYRAEK